MHIYMYTLIKAFGLHWSALENFSLFYQTETMEKHVALCSTPYLSL